MRRLWLLAAVMLGVSGLVLGAEGAAGATTATFTSTTIGTSGSTPAFVMSGPWTMSWSFNCASYGTAGSFVVTVNQPAGDMDDDVGPNEFSTSGSGTDSYFDTGSFNLSIISECDWSITVAHSGAAPSSTPLTLSSSQIGDSGSTPQFDVTAPWTMSWSYNCANLGTTRNFIVGVHRWTGALTFDVGPNELGIGGNGTDTYHNSGTFNLTVDSECAWSITVSRWVSTPTPSLTPVVGMAADSATGGYWEVASDGGIFSYHAPFYGSMGGKHLNQPVVGMAATPTGGGYWLVARDGGVFAFGNAQFYGSMGGKALNQPVVGIASDPTTGGYWEVASDGGVFSFNAPFYGSMGGKRLNQPVVGIAPDAATGGYWEVASDGGVFSFNAIFFGSMGGKPLNKPVVAMSASPTGEGYRLVASDGGIFDFGTATFFGSMGGKPLNAPVLGMSTTRTNGGYWEVASDGGIFAFGDAQFYGSQG